MIEASKVAWVVVTRGGLDFSEITESIPGDRLHLWDNSGCEKDLKVYGRYHLAEALKSSDVIAVQDDDAVIEGWPELLAAYEPGVVTCNMGQAHVEYYAPMGISLVGFGAVFDRSLIEPTFARYFNKFERDELFLRECDRVFTGLNKLKVLTVPYRNLPHEQTTERMWREPRHGADLAEIQRRIAAVRLQKVASASELSGGPSRETIW